MFFPKQPKADEGKECSSARALILTSHTLAECPNHLEHWSTCFSLSLTLHWEHTGLVPGIMTLYTAICSDLLLFSALAHHLSKDSCTFANGIPSLKLNFLSCFTVLLNNMFLLNDLKQMSEKNVVLRGAQTLTSHSLGDYPNHLEHWSTGFSLSLTLHWELIGLVPGTLTLCNAICSDVSLFSASAHHLSEDICMFYILEQNWRNIVESIQLTMVDLRYFMRWFCGLSNPGMQWVWMLVWD